MKILALNHILITLYVVLFSALPCAANSADVSPVKIVGDIKYLVDDDGSLSVSHVTNTPKGQWSQITTENINFGINNKTHWYQFTVRPQKKSSNSIWLFEIAWPLLSEVDVYVLSGDNENISDANIDHLLEGGVLRPKGRSYLSHRNPLVPILLEPNKDTEILIRVRTSAFHLVPLQFVDKDTFLRRTGKELIFHGVAFGFLVVIFFYNLLLGLSSREDIFVKYSIYVVCISVWLTDVIGYRSQFLWIEWLNPSFYVMSGLLFFPPCISFLRSLLGLKKVWPAADKLLYWSQWVCAPLLIYNYLNPDSAILLAQVYCSLAIYIAFFIVIKRMLDKDRIAVWFFVAWIILIVAVAIFQGACMGIFPLGEETITGVLYGAALETVLLSLLIGQRYNALKKEKAKAVKLSIERLEEAVQEKQERLKAQEDLLDIQKNQNIILEQKVATRTAELEGMVNEKSTFLSHLSHELRSPLNGLIGMLSLIEERLEQKDLKSSVAQTIGVGDYLANLINNFLDFSKIEQEQLGLESIEFSLKELVDDCIAMLRTKADEKKIQIISKVSKDVPELIYGDPTRLKQVIVNLSNNALKFTEQGSVSLIAELKGDKVRITVRDTGIGIPQDKLETIFEAYSQASSDTTRRYGGTGLGLDISQKIVQLMGSNIKVDSELGKGSSFYFHIPLKLGNSVQEAADNAIKGECAFHVGDVNRVLVVEDNVVNLMVLEKQLEKMGITVSTAENGEQALVLLRDTVFDLILMDVNMPIMDGIEAVKKIRQLDIRSQAGLSVPVVALTGVSDKKEINACFQAGMDAYLAKPITQDRLADLVQSDRE